MYEFIYYEVRDVMTPDPITVHQDVTFEAVEAIFEEHDFNGLPVVDENNRLIGMITKLDILEAFAITKRVMIPQYTTIMRYPVSQIMVKKPQVFTPQTPLTRVLQKMVETGHKSFPVVDGGRVVGVVAREDILRALRRSALEQLPARLCLRKREGLLKASDIEQKPG